MALPQAKQDVLAARIAGLSLPQGGWAGAARADALARLSAMGLPVKRDEYWRYTDPTSLTTPDTPHAAVFDARDEPPAFDGIDRLVEHRLFLGVELDLDDAIDHRGEFAAVEFLLDQATQMRRQILELMARWLRQPQVAEPVSRS